MPVKSICAGPFVTESEREAFRRVKRTLERTGQPGLWIILTNLQAQYGNHRLPDDLDMVIIGPPGVVPIEVKHWSEQTLRTKRQRVDEAAVRLNEKVRRLKGYLRRNWSQVGFVGGRLLLTDGDRPTSSQTIQGVPVAGLGGLRHLLPLNEAPRLSDTDVRSIASDLCPRTWPDESLKTFRHYAELKLCSPVEDKLRRVYQGQARPGPKVLLHIYDLSASAANDREEVCRRESEAFRILQKLPCVPAIVDSFQEVPGYDGEIYLFSYQTSQAASLRKRCQDQTWSTEARRTFALAAIEALISVHQLELLQAI